MYMISSKKRIGIYNAMIVVLLPLLLITEN